MPHKSAYTNLDYQISFQCNETLEKQNSVISYNIFVQLKTLQDNIFDLTQLILTKKIDQARDLVKDLTLQGEDEIKLIAIMLGQFRLYTQVKILQESGQTESQMVSSLGHYLGRNPNPYQIKFALRDTRGLSLNFLQDSIRYLIQADYQIKTGVYEKGYLFEKALLQIASQSN